MVKNDAESVVKMMREFYASPAVHTNGSEEIFERDVHECVSDSPFAEGYVFSENDEIVGYSMLAKSFSTEGGRRCVWIEDLYLLPKARKKGYASAFFDFIFDKYKGYVFRLEVEKENYSAVSVYEKKGFFFIDYNEMLKI